MLTDVGILKTEVEEKQFKIKLLVIDIPEFDENADNLYSWLPVANFVDDQHGLYMQQEHHPKRTNKADLRVHVCLYYIFPTGHMFVAPSPRA